MKRITYERTISVSSYGVSHVFLISIERFILQQISSMFLLVYPASLNKGSSPLSLTTFETQPKHISTNQPKGEDRSLY